LEDQTAVLIQSERLYNSCSIRTIAPPELTLLKYTLIVILDLSSSTPIISRIVDTTLTRQLVLC